LHNNVQQLLGIATATGADMAVHHAATLALVALSYVYGLTRMGVLALVSSRPGLPATTCMQHALGTTVAGSASLRGIGPGSALPRHDADVWPA
jgi:hypothetical protein